MLQGLRTAAYQVKELDKAKAWYGKVLGLQPYFDQPFYVGFNVGGFELGLVPAEDTKPNRAPAFPTLNKRFGDKKKLIF